MNKMNVVLVALAIANLGYIAISSPLAHAQDAATPVAPATTPMWERDGGDSKCFEVDTETGGSKIYKHSDTCVKPATALRLDSQSGDTWCVEEDTATRGDNYYVSHDIGDCDKLPEKIQVGATRRQWEAPSHETSLCYEVDVATNGKNFHALLQDKDCKIPAGTVFQWGSIRRPDNSMQKVCFQNDKETSGDRFHVIVGDYQCANFNPNALVDPSKQASGSWISDSYTKTLTWLGSFFSDSQNTAAGSAK